MQQKPSPAQRAVQLTFVLKGHLKNAQLSYLRVAAGLAQMRDQRLFAALKHDSLESYAKERLGLGRAAVYRYMQIHDWVREFHPAWLGKKPKGFIPELTDTYALMWIERKLASGGLSDTRRRELERHREKALAGQLSDDEFEAVRAGARREKNPFAALISSLCAARRRAKALPSLPATVLAEIDALIARIEALADATKKVAKLLARPARARRGTAAV
jgi:hypothetical protein